MKKILFVSTKSVWGGAQSYIIDLVKNLPRDQFEIEVASGGHGPLVDKVKELNIPFHPIPELERNINPLGDLGAFLIMIRLFRKIRPDILHLNSSKTAAMGALAGRIARVPKIVSSTHGWPFLEERPRWQRYVIRFVVKFSLLFQDAVICVSKLDYSIGINFRIAPKEKLIQIHNGIDPKKFIFIEHEKARELLRKTTSAPIDNNTCIVGTIAEFTKNKGLFYLVEAAAHIIKIKPNTVFLVIGGGEEKTFLEQKIAHFQLEKNFFLIDYLPEAFAYLKAFDIFAFPSIKEGFPYVLLEASLAKLPIIASRVGGNPEIVVQDKTGLLVHPASPEGLIKEIIYLENNASLRNKLGEAGNKHTIENFSIASMIEKTIRVYIHDRPHTQSKWSY